MAEEIESPEVNKEEIDDLLKEWRVIDLVSETAKNEAR